jgi:hypothetical protein
MSRQTEESTKHPKAITALLFLERQSPIDYSAMLRRVGPTLGLDLAQMGHLEPNGPMLLPAGDDLVIGVPANHPYPIPDELQQLTRFAYWWPNALDDLARHKALLTVHCSWAKESRVDAHKRHLVLVRELVEQLPVIGVLWGSSLMQTDTFKGEFANAMKGGFRFSVWILIQFSQQPNDNILISTLGMRDFEQMEIETESGLPLDQTFDLVRKLGSYILGSGAVVKDGDTIQLEGSAHIARVRHTRSFRPDVNDKVYWVELTEKPTVRKPTGFFSALFGSNSKQ